MVPCAIATILTTTAGGGSVPLRAVGAAQSQVLPPAGLIYLQTESRRPVNCQITVGGLFQQRRPEIWSNLGWLGSAVVSGGTGMSLLNLQRSTTSIATRAFSPKSWSHIAACHERRSEYTPRCPARSILQLREIRATPFKTPEPAKVIEDTFVNYSTSHDLLAHSEPRQSHWGRGEAEARTKTAVFPWVACICERNLYMTCAV